MATVSRDQTKNKPVELRAQCIACGACHGHQGSIDLSNVIFIRILHAPDHCDVIGTTKLFYVALNNIHKKPRGLTVPYSRKQEVFVSLY